MTTPEATPKTWVVVAMSCGSCNTQAVSLMSRRPTEADLEAARREAGGGYCVAVYVTEAAVDGGPAELGGQDDFRPASPAEGGGGVVQAEP